MSTNSITRGQQLNTNSDTSVANPSQNNNPKKRCNIKGKHNKKNKIIRPFMMISEEDWKWLKGKPNSVKELFIDCWLADPYGSRWQVLSHSLKPTSFSNAKKLISSSGLFVFKPDCSIRDGRETVCWLVMNLHGSRKKDYWRESEELLTNKNPKNLKEDPKNLKENPKNLKENFKNLNSISPETTQNQSLPDPSRTPHEHLTNTSVVVKVFNGEQEKIDPWDGDRDHKFALGEQLASASPDSEKKVSDNDSSLPTKLASSSKANTPEVTQDSSALNKKSTYTRKELWAKSVDELLALNFETWNLSQLEMLPLFESKGHEFTNDVPKKEREKVKHNFQLRTEYLNRRFRAIQKRTEEEITSLSGKSSPSALTSFKERLNDEHKKKKLADHRKRLAGDKPTWLK